MSVNQCQDPTPEQEAMHERDCEIAALKEQIVVAVNLVTRLQFALVSYAKDDECASCQGAGTYGKDASDAIKPYVDAAIEFLDQNESIVKGQK